MRLFLLLLISQSAMAELPLQTYANEAASLLFVSSGLPTLSIRFGAMPKDSGWVAYCKPFEKELVIDPYRWQFISHTEKVFLLMHELGHCLLNIHEHRESIGCDERNFMSTTLPPLQCQEKVVKWYRKTLVERGARYAVTGER